jgi:ABC-type cobalamin/Fe3+-siderophores transport system ATPase subunit
MLRAGKVIASGSTSDVLTPANIKALYGVEADVCRHGGSGQLIVVPTGRGEAHP